MHLTRKYVLVFSAVVYGCIAQDPGADRPAAPLQAAVGHVAPRTSSPASFLGVLVPLRTVVISAQRAGQVTEVPAAVGQNVRPGDTVAIIDSSIAAQEMSVARSEQRATAARVQEAQIALQDATDARRRMEAAGANVYSSREVEAARAKEAAARAALHRTEAELDQRAAESRVRQTLFSQSVAVAPMEGTVGMIFHEVGEYVEEGTPLVRIVSNDIAEVRFAVPEDQSLPHVGALATLRLRHSNVILGSASVERFTPELDSASGMRFVDARLLSPLPDGTSFGAAVDVTISLGRDGT